MVLWEITLATAYFLGLKRTYRVALKLQRRLLKRPKLRNFLRRRTRIAFDVALSVHKKVQERDLDVGRSLGNWTLRWLDRLKPSAQIRPSSPPKQQPPPSNNMPKHAMNAGQSARTRNLRRDKIIDIVSNKRLFSSSWPIRPKYFPTVAMVMMHPANTTAVMSHQCRHIGSSYDTFTREASFRRGIQSVFRKDIEQWMLCN